MTNSRAHLCRAIDYDFRDADLLDKALTHRSAGNRNNERLEYLGDALLSFVIAGELFRREPDADEGHLSRLRAHLVRGRKLAEIAAEIGLGDCLILGSGELKTGGFRRASILADAFEALLGAVYLDGGYDTARRCVLNLYAERFGNLPSADELKDPKTRLQELLQARSRALPEYVIEDVTGDAHKQTFFVRCRTDDGTIVRGQGSSRRRAEQDAARHALAALAEVTDSA